MMPTAFNDYIVSGESQTLEFKALFGKASTDSLVGFAKGYGGAVLAGVAALKERNNAIEKILQWLHSQTLCPEEVPRDQFCD